MGRWDSRANGYKETTVQGWVMDPTRKMILTRPRTNKSMILYNKGVPGIRWTVDGSFVVHGVNSRRNKKKKS